MLSKLMDVLSDMQPRRLLLLAGIVGVVMFAIFFLSLNLWAKSQSEKIEDKIPAEKTVVQNVSVVVAKSDIAPRTVIKENMLQLKEISADAVPEGAIKKFSEVVNTPARTAIFAGDVITKKKFYADMSQAGFIGSIPADCRAISIGISDVTGVDGFVKPGDYVDLLLVENTKGTAVSSVLLQNVLLLSIDQNMSGDEQNSEENSNTKAVSKPSIATLALKPNDALKLVSASKLGEIYLMLRPVKPSNMYTNDSDYTAVSSITPPVKNETPVQTQIPTPAILPPIPSASETKLPDIPANTDNSTTNNFEIIQGDKVIQNKGL